MLRQKHNGSIAEMGEQIDTLNKVLLNPKFISEIIVNVTS